MGKVTEFLLGLSVLFFIFTVVGYVIGMFLTLV
jgi:hypothetical protein